MALRWKGETMASTGAVPTEACMTCKSPSKEASRSLCAPCLNRNLQRACEKTRVLSGRTPKTGLRAPRALFPGMPRAVLGPAHMEKGYHIPAPHSRVLIAGDNAPPSSGLGMSDLRQEVDASSRCDTSKDKQNQRGERANVTGAEGKSIETMEQENHVRLVEDGAKVAIEKWHLFQIQKNLTVRIPNPPTDIWMQPCRPQPLAVPSNTNGHVSLPARQFLPRNAVRPIKVKRWAIQPNANAEAELMMRLLADSIPILKSTAPLVLPPCKIRPASMSPLSPPGDPLWKRRCIPCPKSLELQITSVCVS